MTKQEEDKTKNNFTNSDWGLLYILIKWLK